MDKHIETLERAKAELQAEVQRARRQVAEARMNIVRARGVVQRLRALECPGLGGRRRQVG